MMDEEAIDRRAHWVWGIGTILVLGTVAFVTLKLTVAQLDSDFREYKKDQKATIRDLDNRLDGVNDKVNANAKDIEWILKGGRK